MNKPRQNWTRSRHIAERIVIKGDLVLLTPAHFGSGDAEGVVDLALLRDARDGSALLPGASIAGALRSYWRERKEGYGSASRDSDLFGARRGARDEMQGDQSLLIVEDSISGEEMQVELRDGVAIDGVTRTAAPGKLFDMEVLRAGTRFPLCFELLIDERPPDGMSWTDYERQPRTERELRLAERRRELCQDLALALQGFEDQEIGIGARKRRGFGRCQVEQWHVWRYNLLQDDGLFSWLVEGRDWPDATSDAALGKTLADKLGVLPLDVDRRYRFEIEAKFALESSLLVRSGAGQADVGADMEHLHRVWVERKGDPKSGKKEPILPGTSLAGALRARARRIANTISSDQVKAKGLVDEIFGVGPEDEDARATSTEKQHWASRLVVHEALVGGVHTLVQNRIRVDRFTGGAMDNYLFNEAPVFAKNSEIVLELVLRDPKRDLDEKGEPQPSYEIGLLLLLLKDLWTGDLPLGGESSVGRGRLRGVSATLRQVTPKGSITWDLVQQGKELGLTAKPEQADVWQSLEGFVQALDEKLTGR